MSDCSGFGRYGFNEAPFGFGPFGGDSFPSPVNTAAEWILFLTDSALTAAGHPVGRKSLVPGVEAAWDNCCAGSDMATGGQVTVRLDSLAGLSVPGRPASVAYQNSAGCTGIERLSAVFEVSVIRCTPTLDDNGIAPESRRVSESAWNIMQDAQIVMQALTVALPQVCGIESIILGGWSPQGVRGGCAGGAWTVTVAVDNPMNCPPEETR